MGTSEVPDGWKALPCFPWLSHWQWMRVNSIWKPGQFRGLKIPITSQRSFFSSIIIYLLQNWDLIVYRIKKTQSTKQQQKSSNEHSQESLKNSLVLFPWCWHCGASLPGLPAQLSHNQTHSSDYQHIPWSIWQSTFAPALLWPETLSPMQTKIYYSIGSS